MGLLLAVGLGCGAEEPSSDGPVGGAAAGHETTARAQGGIGMSSNGTHTSSTVATAGATGTVRGDDLGGRGGRAGAASTGGRTGRGGAVSASGRTGIDSVSDAGGLTDLAGTAGTSLVVHAGGSAGNGGVKNLGGMSSAAGSAQIGGANGTRGSCAAIEQFASYDACDGNTIYPDGSCFEGSCATTDLQRRVFREWWTQVKALTGFSDSKLAERVKITSLDLNDAGGEFGIFVRIQYVVVLDWVRSRQADSPSFSETALTQAPTDAEIKASVALAIEKAEWTGLAAIDTVASEAVVQAAFDSCTCGMSARLCDIDFENVTGSLLLRAFKEIDFPSNRCQESMVNLATGSLYRCMDTPCWIE